MAKSNPPKKPTQTPRPPVTAPPPTPPECLTLQQKFVELRKAVPCIVKEQHSDGVKYKYAKIDDVWEAITPVMNVIGVNFDVVKEETARKDELGNPVYFTTIATDTRNGPRLMFLYEADLTIQWLNTDNEDDKVVVTLHAIGWQDDPAKAKGSAWTYCLKYYLFEKFSIDQGADDPDNNDLGARGVDGSPKGTQQQTSAQSGKLSKKQLDRLYLKGKDADRTEEQVRKQVLKRYGKKDPADMTRKEYDDICVALDKTKALLASQTAAPPPPPVGEEPPPVE